MRKLTKVMLIVAILAVAVMSLVACSPADAEYYKKVSSYKFWANKGDTAIAQTKVHDIVNDHIADENGRKKKVLVIGFDGGRADGLANIIKTDSLDGKNDYSGHNDDQLYSGMNLIRSKGGAYLSYAGGEKGKANQQHTSTAPGWAAINTGVWGETNGITNNNMAKNIENKTMMLKAAESNGMKTEFVAQWDEHFSLSYKSEIDYLAQNTDITMSYTKKANDKEMHEYLKTTLTEGNVAEKDFVFTIYESPDYNGHATNFGNSNYRYASAMKNIDMYAYDLIKIVEARPSYNTEDWLIVMTSDHGGLLLSHGGQTLEERTTFIVTNKPIAEKYFSKGYDGYKTK